MLKESSGVWFIFCDNPGCSSFDRVYPELIGRPACINYQAPMYWGKETIKTRQGHALKEYCPECSRLLGA